MFTYPEDQFRRDARLRGFIRWAVRMAFMAISVWVIWILWPHCMTSVLGIRTINYWEAGAFFLLFRALMGWPEILRVADRDWQREQNMRMESMLQRLFAHYFGPRHPQSEEDKG